MDLCYLNQLVINKILGLGPLSFYFLLSFISHQLTQLLILKLKTMQTILTVALGTIFPKENIDSIMEVIGATPNPDVATQILLGIYQAPGMQTQADIGGVKCHFIRYDKWTDAVTYWYMQQETKHIYISKDTDKTQITEENYETFKVSYDSENSVSYSVKLSTQRKVETTCGSEYWNSKPLFEDQ